MMRDQRPTYGNYQPKPRFNNFTNQRGQHQRHEQIQEYGWTSLLRQMKLEHENCTDVQLGLKLADSSTAEKALHVLRCRKVSAPGHIRMKVIECWDGPAESTKLKDPAKTVLEWYQDHGLEIRCAYLPVLVVKEEPNAEAEQIPLEHLDVEAPIIRVKREALPWMRKDASRPLNGGQNSSNATSGSPPAAAPAPPIELAAILGELAELKNKVEEKKSSVKKSELKKLQADADEKEKKLKAAESSADQLRSLLEAFKKANPKAVLPEHDVLDRIVNDSEKPPEISGRAAASISTKKLLIDTSAQEKAVKPTSTS